MNVISVQSEQNGESQMHCNTLKKKFQALPQLAQVALIAAVGTLLTLVAVIAVRATADVVTTPTVLEPRPSEAARLVLRHIAWADEQNAAGVDAELEPVREFFAAARARSRAYATEVLGWESKLNLVSDYFLSNGDHHRFLQARFAALLFSDDELDAVIEQAVAGYLTHVSDVEAQLLVHLEADLADLPADQFPVTLDRAALSATLQAALNQATTAAQADFRGMIGRELVSWIAGEALTVATVHLATSAGILSTGAASGWTTFGASIVVGLIVDAFVTEIYNQQYDPAGELSRKLEASLSQMESLILDGASDDSGLRYRLYDYSTQRNAALQRSLEQAIRPVVSF